MPNILAKHRCLHCGHRWSDKPGSHVCCPKCGWLYVKWENYEHLAKKHGWKR